MDEKNESPRTENGTRTFSNEWVVTDNGKEIAVISMSVTTLRNFQNEKIGKLLSFFAEASRSFYLEAGKTLKTEP